MGQVANSVESATSAFPGGYTRYMKDFTGKVAIITGASSGIGRATALALARRGARVALAARRAAELEAVAEEIRALGREALCIPTDVSSRQEVSRLVDEAMAGWGRLDIVVANAGAYVRCRLAGPAGPQEASPVGACTIEAFERSMAVNFYGALYPVLAALPHLVAQGSGHIVLVSSMDGKKGIPPDAPYVAAKFALAGFGDVLRQELHGSGVDVTTVFPGRVDTPLIASLKVPAMSAKIPPDAVADAIVAGICRRQPEVIVPFHARSLLWVNGLSPRLGDWAVRTFRLEGWD